MARQKKNGPGRTGKAVKKAAKKGKPVASNDGARIAIDGKAFSLKNLKDTFDFLDLSIDVAALTSQQFEALRAFFTTDAAFEVCARKVGTNP